MDPRRWDEVQRLFELSQDVPEGERRAWLEARCASDAELLEEVWDLLQQDLPSGFGDSPLERPEGDPAEGRVLGGFRLIRVLGQGGMGTVYLAEQENVGRLVAVKVLPPFGANERARERFRREAKVVAGLDHPHVVPLLVADETDHLAWYAMRFVGGWDLNQELEHQRQARSGRGTPELMLPPFGAPDHVAAVAERMADLADAVQHAHSRGVVHRDVKPHNVLIDPRGRFHLTDFGLARDESQGTIHASGDLLGTPHYMSPEQARALEDPVDHRTDVYSLGVVLYECLTLKRPFEGRTSQEVLANITRREPPSLRVANPAVPRDLAVIVEKAMGKRPSWRYDSAQALADDLRRFLRGEPVLARRPGFVERSARWVQRHRTTVTVAGMLLAGLVAGDMWSTRRQVRAGFAEDQALIESALASPDWWGAEGPPLDAATSWRRLQDQEGGVPRVLASTHGRMSARMGQDLRACQLQVRSIRQQAVQGAQGESRVLVDRSLLESSVQFAQRALVLHSDDPFLQEAARIESVWPRLDVELDPRTRDLPDAPARAQLWSVNPMDGSWSLVRELGALPVRKVPVPPGNHVVRVLLADGRRGEFARYFAPGTGAYTLSCRLLFESELPPGFVAVPDSVLTLVRTGPHACVGGGVSVEVRGFEVRTTCVSNAEVVAYLQAEPKGIPEIWASLGYPDGRTWRELMDSVGVERWERLPAVFLTLEESCRVAEHYGCRLPMHHEAELYLRGPEGQTDVRPLPGSGPGLVNVSAPEPYWGGAEDVLVSWYRQYLQRVEPVDSPQHIHAPFGLHHAMGNIWERTLSPVVEREGRDLVALPYQSTILGLGYDCNVQDLGAHGKAGWSAAHGRADTGFRLVRFSQ